MIQSLGDFGFFFGFQALFQEPNLGGSHNCEDIPVAPKKAPKVAQQQLGSGNSNILNIFNPKIGEDEPILTNIFFKWAETTNQTIFGNLLFLHLDLMD